MIIEMKEEVERWNQSSGSLDSDSSFVESLLEWILEDGEWEKTSNLSDRELLHSFYGILHSDNSEAEIEQEVRYLVCVNYTEISGLNTEKNRHR